MERYLRSRSPKKDLCLFCNEFKAFMIWQNILMRVAEERRMLAVLVDPDKGGDQDHAALASKAQDVGVSMILVGGSVLEQSIDHCISVIKSACDLPVIIFPGDFEQISEKADALLYLSLASGRNPEYLMGQQVKGARALRKTKLEVVPTGYLLIESGSVTAVERVSNTAPLPINHVEEIVDTAYACQLLGMKCVYLEAGSGAKLPVPQNIISAVRDELSIPLIVGGGMRTPTAVGEAFSAGADIVVVGTLLEQSPDQLIQLQKQL